MTWWYEHNSNYIHIVVCDYEVKNKFLLEIDKEMDKVSFGIIKIFILVLSNIKLTRIKLKAQ